MSVEHRVGSSNCGAYPELFTASQALSPQGVNEAIMSATFSINWKHEPETTGGC